MIYASRTTALHLAGLAILGVAVFWPVLSAERYIGGVEAVHAEMAREMVEAGDYIVPRRCGVPFTEKPPLFNDMVALLFRLSRTSDIALARIPSALAALATALAIYLLGRRWYGADAGLWSAAIWVTFPLVIKWACVARGDMLLACLILWAILLADFSCASKGRAWAWWCGSGLVLGGAVLAKGEQAFFFYALAVAAIHRTRCGRWRPPLRWMAAAGAIALMPACAWAMAVELRNPGHVAAFARYHLTQGFTEHPKRWYLYADRLFALTLPWSLFALGAVLQAAKRLWRKGFDMDAIPLVVLAVGLACMTLVPNKRAHYLLPILPFWALLLGTFIAQATKGEREPTHAACIESGVTA